LTDESRTAGGADLELLLLAVAEIVPDDDAGLLDGPRELCESSDRRVSTEAREVAASGFLMDAGPGT
jgi:hypothetical protein